MQHQNDASVLSGHASFCVQGCWPQKRIGQSPGAKDKGRMRYSVPRSQTSLGFNAPDGFLLACNASAGLEKEKRQKLWLLCPMPFPSWIFACGTTRLRERLWNRRMLG